MTNPDDMLKAFVRESNRIEGIGRTTEAHIRAHRQFLDGPVTIPALVALVSVLQPNARFRNMVSVPGVRVGNHIAPPSGPDIEGNLRSILAMRNPWEQHVAYETLHPFTDGNGRSGRAIWLHRHWHEDALDAWAVRRGFLHSFYYQTLGGVRAEASIQPADDAVEPVAYLKTWQSVEGYPRSRVDLTDVCEPWLAELKPTITPLVPALAPQGEKAEG